MAELRTLTPMVPWGTYTLFRLLIVFALSLASFCCPQLCSCPGGAVNCTSKNLRFVPENISPLTTALSLAHNDIASLRPNSFRRLERLQSLELQHNGISLLLDQAFEGLWSLRYLDLSFNHITSLRPESFKSLPSLTTLNLGYNRIGSLDPGVLVWFPSLQELFLNDNALRTLEAGVLQPLPSAVSLRLDGNPWACTCLIFPLWTWMAEHRDRIREKDSIRCGPPGNWDQYPVLNIRENRFHRCLENFNSQDYLYISFIGIALSLFSIVVCFTTGLAAVTCQRLQLRYRKRAHIYKKNTCMYENTFALDVPGSHDTMKHR
ncbi:leucine-rich repeat-containing protein 26 [Lissotriton helveticus]